MSKKMQVIVIFEFDDVDALDSEKADEIVQGLTQATEEWAEGFINGHRPFAAWVEEVYMNEEV